MVNPHPLRSGFTPGQLVGRDAELHELTEALDGVTNPHGPVRLILGPAGVGKTRLADELSGIARRRDITVAWGHCPDELTAPALWPWTQIVRQLQGEERGTDLAALVLDEPGPVDRFELFDATAAVIAQAASERPVLIVIDDLHRADQASWQLTRFIARHLRELRVSIVATVRTTAMSGDAGDGDGDGDGVEGNGAEGDDVEGDSPFAVHLDALARHGQVTRLSNLDVVAVGDLLGDHSSAQIVFELTAGNPLHVEQVRQAAGTLGTSIQTASTTEALEQTLLRRMEALPTAARHLLECIAVLGAPVDARQLAALTESTDPIGRFGFHGVVGVTVGSRSQLGLPA